MIEMPRIGNGKDVECRARPSTNIVWPTRNTGVPKNRANASAFSANQSSPNTFARCSVRRVMAKMMVG